VKVERKKGNRGRKLGRGQRIRKANNSTKGKRVQRVKRTPKKRRLFDELSPEAENVMGGKRDPPQKREEVATGKKTCIEKKRRGEKKKNVGRGETPGGAGDLFF